MVGVWVVRRALVFALFVRWFIMAYSIVAIREVEDQEGDWIYPTASLDGTSLIQIAEDEYPSSPITFRALSVHAFSPTRTVKLVDWQETGEMIITRDRVTVALEKFERGARWTGTGVGVVVALGAMAVSAAMAANRRRGKLLLGQVRYPWLLGVGSAHTRKGPQLRLLCQRSQQDGGATLALTLTLPHKVDAAGLAQLVTTRAADWRLQNSEEMTTDDWKVLRSLLEAPRLEPTQSFAWHSLPGALAVS